MSGGSFHGNGWTAPFDLVQPVSLKVPNDDNSGILTQCLRCFQHGVEEASSADYIQFKSEEILVLRGDISKKATRLRLDSILSNVF